MRLILLLMLWSASAASGAVGRNGDVLVFEDKTRALSVADVVKGSDRLGFMPMKSDGNYGFSESAFWLRMSLTNSSDHEEQIYVDWDYALLDLIDFHVIGSAGSVIAHYRSGDQIPFSTRPIAYRTHVFPVTVAAGGTVDCVVRVQSSGRVRVLSKVWSKDEFLSHATFENLLMGLLYGCLITVLIYNFFLALTTREHGFLLYVGLIATTTIYYAVFDGTAFELFWPNSPRWANACVPGLVYGVNLGSLGFSADYLDIRRRMPRTWKIYRALMVTMLVGIVLSPFIPYRLAVVSSLILIIPIASLLLATAVYAARRGYRPAYFYAPAWAVFLVMSLMTVLTSFGLFQVSGFAYFLSVFGPHLGSVAEAVLISIGLGDKYNMMKRERALSQAKLRDNLYEIVRSTQDMGRSGDLIAAQARAMRSLFDTLAHLGIKTLDTWSQVAKGWARLVFTDEGVWLEEPRSAIGERPTEGPGVAVTSLDTARGGTFLLRVVYNHDSAISPEDRNFIGAIASSLAIAIENIQYTTDLHSIVQERTQKVRYLLENMQQGVLTFGSSLKINAEFSQFLCDLYGVTSTEVSGRGVVDFIFPGGGIGPDRMSVMNEVLGMAFEDDDLMGFKINDWNLATEAEIVTQRGPRTIALSWHPIARDKGAIENVMLTIQDITKESALRKKLADADKTSAETMRIVSQLIHPKREKVQGFFIEHDERVQKFPSTVSPETGPTLRYLHTLKGHVRTLGFEQLTDTVHEAETDPVSDQLARIAGVYDRYRGIFADVLNGFSSTVATNEQTLGCHVAQILQDVHHGLVSGGLSVGRFSVSEDVIAWKPSALHAVRDIVMHALTNAADHGFILPAARGLLGKEPACFAVSCAMVETRLVIEISDNGAGFNLPLIRETAVKRGIDTMGWDDAQLLELLFSERFSTAESTSKRSGRGIGMAAVRSAAQALDGAVELRNQQPHGALVRIIFPLAAVRETGAQPPGLAA